MYSKTAYPKYQLKVVSNQGTTNHCSKQKKSFLMKLNKLKKAKGLKSFSFSVEYCKDGFNESIDYRQDQIDEAIKVARIFTAEDEIKSNMKK